MTKHNLFLGVIKESRNFAQLPIKKTTLGPHCVSKKVNRAILKRIHHHLEYKGERDDFFGTFTENNKTTKIVIGSVLVTLTPSTLLNH